MGIKLNDLNAEFRDKLVDLLHNCEKRGVRMVPYQGLRTPQQQAIYWRQSRTVSQINTAVGMLRQQGAPFLADVLETVGPRHGPEITKALPGNSWHQWGEAADCFWEVNGETNWSTTEKINGVNGYQVYAAEAKKLKLDAGLNWAHFKDSPHVQKRSTANPKSSGLSWPEIDAAMRQRFASDIVPDPRTFGFEAPAAALAHDRLRVSYTAPEGWRTYESTDTPATIFRAGMMICADGAPKAYHKSNDKALDYLANAGRPGNWWAIVTDERGKPVVQKASDPAPGYYVSTTSLMNPGFSDSDPSRYVDASKVPFIVLPARRFTRFTTTAPLRLSDLGVAYNIANGRMCLAQFAETGPVTKIGEASIALAEALGVNSNPKKGGLDNRQILYAVFPSTGIGRGMTKTQIDAAAQPIFNRWGGEARLRTYGSI